MAGNDIDPTERALLRSKLPPELLATIDNAESAMNARIDDTIEEFKKTVQARLTDFTSRDFAAEMKAAVKSEQDALLKNLEADCETLAKQIDAVNKAVAKMQTQDAALTAALGDLETAHKALDTELKEFRTKVAAVGSTLAGIAKKAVSGVLTGLF